MSRIGKILGIVAAVLIVAIAIGGYVVNKAAFGIPGFVVWRTLSSAYHGGQRAHINGISLYYQTYGAGRPVLVLHGAGAVSETMHPFIRDLAGDHLVIAPDSRAQGRSTDAPGPITYSMMGADMIALLDHLHIKQVDVIGWSDGGIIGLDMAMKHPERVRRLIAIGANYTPDGVAPGTLSGPEIADAQDESQRLYEMVAPDPAHFAIVQKKIETMLKTEPNYTIADLGRIHAPTLIVAGDHDMILRKHTDSLAKAIPTAKEIIVPDASHFGPLEKPDVYASMARSFLDAK